MYEDLARAVRVTITRQNHSTPQRNGSFWSAARIAAFPFFFTSLAFLECGDSSPLWLFGYGVRQGIAAFVSRRGSRTEIVSFFWCLPTLGNKSGNPLPHSIAKQSAAKNRRTPKKPHQK
jgi:hypothetical protein